MDMSQELARLDTAIKEMEARLQDAGPAEGAELKEQLVALKWQKWNMQKQMANDKANPKGRAFTFGSSD